jgi:serine phosphatase RsbU (regulator of sigma subunit)
LESEKKQQNTVRNALLGGLGLLGLLAFVVVRSLRLQRKATVAITASRERLEVMSEVGRSLTASLAVETIITNLYQRVSEVMDATVFGIGIVRREKNVIENKLVMDAGKRLPLYERDMNDKNQFAVWCIDNAASVFINDVDVEGTRYIPAFREKINVVEKDHNNYAKSMLYVPLLLQGSVVGIISVQSYNRNAYSEADLETLKTLANYAAIAIANAESTEEIIRQKAIVEEFNRNIQDSIRYAKRIQDAMLPSQETLNRLLPEHFIFFRPKDVVSGDFYWCKERDGFVFVAAVDCTGHGVPGAFMSLIGNAMLNELTERLPDPRPEFILREMHYGLQRALKQRETGNEDGMDVCLCRIDLRQRRVLFAGAMSPLYVVMGNNDVLEYKGTQEELGGSEERHPVYEAHEIDLSGTAAGCAMLYLTSDGYKDQFNEKRKKLTAKGVKEVIAGVCGAEMGAQREGFGAAMERWMGSIKQMDDMLVLGVRL